MRPSIFASLVVAFASLEVSAAPANADTRAAVYHKAERSADPVDNKSATEITELYIAALREPDNSKRDKEITDLYIAALREPANSKTDKEITDLYIAALREPATSKRDTE
ncbi:uncharacterized protein E0L32_011496 [Thyridium curvatum]|uniref:Uncharacterized protein n=1 Tax=Thyridium curvatum TaxID=1093900 RepID=A0A507BFX6_9PEZI|nr:uncharacterized protein E0L32_011496 [Thyridium curvatum]TPX18817.1 hypothetical protein E0L32_011496 [Thyridium curvatum]